MREKEEEEEKKKKIVSTIARGQTFNFFQHFFNYKKYKVLFEK